MHTIFPVKPIVHGFRQFQGGVRPLKIFPQREQQAIKSTFVENQGTSMLNRINAEINIFNNVETYGETNHTSNATVVPD
jgi:hypothetical protein